MRRWDKDLTDAERVVAERVANDRDRYGAALNEIALMIPEQRRPPPGDVDALVRAVAAEIKRLERDAGMLCSACENYATREVSWSDRSMDVCDDHLIYAVRCAAFDGSYDRTRSPHIRPKPTADQKAAIDAMLASSDVDE